MNSFMYVSIVKQKTKNMKKYCFPTQKSVKITKACSILGKTCSFRFASIFL
eukprot:UN05164